MRPHQWVALCVALSFGVGSSVGALYLGLPAVVAGSYGAVVGVATQLVVGAALNP